MISDARGSHVSPGIYTEERDVTYSVKSLGITSLGLVGETLYGPAFQKVEIENWGEFVDYFGGTSTEKFKGSDLPKYELPYIAKEYLSESKRLNVVRVLGLSGYDAGDAWALKDKKGNVICVLRSKMEYNDTEGDACNPVKDGLMQVVKNITFKEYEEKVFGNKCSNTVSSNKINDNVIKFKIVVKTEDNSLYLGHSFEYNVTLNPNDSNYIYNVLNNRPDSGSAPIYIESVYENSMVEFETVKADEVSGVTSEYAYVVYDGDESASTGFYKIENGNTSGEVLTTLLELDKQENGSKVNVEGVDYSDFKSQFRFAQTPWVISDSIVESLTDESGATHYAAHMRKLFKFVTISDGNAANYQVKVSIQNIKPKDGTFDVYVRDFNDTDANPVILERFTKCNLVEGDANYIAFKIGTFDGGFVSKSKYIAVIMSDGDNIQNAIPAGFLGYPMPNYGGNNFVLRYNNDFRPEVKAKRQYFGMSNLAGKYGIDLDILSFKGKFAYDNASNDAKAEKLCNGFHMDSAIDECGENVYVDGVSGYKFTVVSSNKVTSDDKAPRLITNESVMNQSIYKDINVRKFTMCFYGGFDGWDVNRSERTNTDEFKSTKYNPSEGNIFSSFENYKRDVEGAVVDLPETAITSDYYAYLAGCREFANPQDVDINIFATPGINWERHTLLTEEIIDIIEDADGGRGGDALYVMASPNSTDAREVAQNFDDYDINSSYACTYFPWVTYYDASNKKYLDLPVTKDVVRNMASTDNNSFPWFAPAGMQRGNVNCIKATFKTTLADEDSLYEVGVNPIKTYARDGVKVWGNKTTYNADSPLNRVNVRRLMIRVKKLVTEAAKNLIFEQYDETLEKQFRGIVEPILADVKSNRGIIDYRVITESTPETRDQHILPAKILIKPTQALEYISISFVVYPESVNFEEN